MSINLERKVKCLVCGSRESNTLTTTATMMGKDEFLWKFNECLHCKMVYLAPRVKSSDLGDYYTEDYLPYRGAQAWGKYAHLVKALPET